MNYRLIICFGALLASMGVASGAVGAHLLEKRVENGQMEQKQLQQYETAVRYQIYHALGLIAIGLVGLQRPSRWLSAAAAVMIAGLLLFCGGLYGYIAAVTMESSMTWLVHVVPFGGGLLIVSWVLLAMGAVGKGLPKA